MTGKITTVLTKREAETYKAQGLHKEARELYSRLLASSPNIDPELKSAIQCQIQGINHELAHAARRKRRPLSVEEIIQMREGWGDKTTASDMLVCAQAFIRIGSYVEALKEFKNLLLKTGVRKSYLNAVADCLVHLHNPQQLPLAAEQLAREVSKTSKIFLAMQLALAEQMAALHHAGHALAIYEYMRKYPNLAVGLDKRIAALKMRDADTPQPDAKETNASSPSEKSFDQLPRGGRRFNSLKLFGRKK